MNEAAPSTEVATVTWVPSPAVSRRRYVEHVPFADCCDSRYVHASGELVLAPVATLQFNRFRMTPREALNVLGIILTEPSADGVSLTSAMQRDRDEP